MSKTIHGVMKMIKQKVMGYLLFFIDDPEKKKWAYEVFNHKKKEKPIAGGNGRRFYEMTNRREAI